MRLGGLTHLSESFKYPGEMGITRLSAMSVPQEKEKVEGKSKKEKIKNQAGNHFLF